MQKGLLTGKVTPAWIASLPPDDHRRNDPKFQEPQLSANVALVESLGEIAAADGKTVSQLAIAWVLRRPEVTAAIVGARRPEQIEQTIAGGDWQLAEAQLTAIEDLIPKG
jgi:aryl-alcohol dehydrogenase-like predicted oxidoreductase